jgi:hypothetical protein
MVRRLLTGIALAALLAGGASAAAPTVLAEANVRGSMVDWAILAPHQKAVLTVSMPDGVVVRSELDATSAPTFSAFGEQGEARPDGTYHWELRLAPVVPEDMQRRLEAARKRGGELAMRRIGRAAGLDRVLAQSGSFNLQGGVFLAAGKTEESPHPTTTKLGSTSAADQVVADDLIVQGRACVGPDCVNNQGFGVETLRIKDINTRIRFDDTSSSAFPNNDWQLTANDSVSGGANKFSIDDITGGKTPFTITAGAPDHSIFVDSSGRLGLGTSTPATSLHISSADVPGIVLEQPASGYLWHIFGSSEFGVGDQTGRVPFRISFAPDNDTLVVGRSGRVGINARLPEANLHVGPPRFGANRDAFIGIGPNPDGNPSTDSALNIGLGETSFGRAAGFFNVRPDDAAVAPNPSLRFLVANTERMIIDNEGFIGLGVANPSNPIQHSSGAVLTAGGVWQSVSSRATKRDIRPLEPADAMAALQGLEPVRFFYKAEPDDEYLGFVAEDVPDVVATADHKRLGPLDVVAVLTKVVQQQQAAMTRQQTTIDELAARLRELEQRQHPQ